MIARTQLVRATSLVSRLGVDHLKESNRRKLIDSTEFAAMIEELLRWRDPLAIRLCTRLG
jgi:hypothetical protein